MRFTVELRQLLNAHHISNIVLSLAFIASKIVPGLCNVLYADDNKQACGLDTREHEILIFLGVVVLWKNRKATNWLHYLSTAYMFAKLANSFLFFRAKPIFGIVYSLIAVLCAVLLPEPVYKESDSIIYFRGDEFQASSSLMRFKHAELDKDPSTVWVVAFFTTWSAECRYLVPVFSKLSEKYSLSNLKFAKLDVGKYPNAAVKFLINTHPTSKQLPSIAIFKSGKQVDRRPLIGSNRRAIPFVFSEENCIREFDLNNLYNECKNSGRKRKDQGTAGKEHEE